MAFATEYVPPIEKETSDFFRNARKILRTGASALDIWTVDRSRDMALSWMGSGREEAQGKVYWGFLDHTGYYRFDTKEVSRIENAPDLVTVVMSCSFRLGENNSAPSLQTVKDFKEALTEHSRLSTFKHKNFARAELTLLNAATGEEV